jgi:hypothetical protein
MSNDVFSNSSYSINATKRFKGVVASSVIIEFSHEPTKTKRVIEIIWYLHLKEVDAFI